jgi:hypothetical protein
MSSIVTYSTEHFDATDTMDALDVTVATYQITDGGIYDEDGIVNGIIVDPSGPSISNIIVQEDTFCGEAIGVEYETYEEDEIKKILRNLKKAQGKQFEQNKKRLTNLIKEKYDLCHDKIGLEQNIPANVQTKTETLISRLDSIYSGPLDTVGLNKKQFLKQRKQTAQILKTYKRFNEYEKRATAESSQNIIDYIQAQLATLYAEKTGYTVPIDADTTPPVITLNGTDSTIEA